MRAERKRGVLCERPPSAPSDTHRHVAGMTPMDERFWQIQRLEVVCGALQSAADGLNVGNIKLCKRVIVQDRTSDPIGSDLRGAALQRN